MLQALRTEEDEEEGFEGDASPGRHAESDSDRHQWPHNPPAATPARDDSTTWAGAGQTWGDSDRPGQDGHTSRPGAGEGGKGKRVDLESLCWDKQMSMWKGMPGHLPSRWGWRGVGKDSTSCQLSLSALLSRSQELVCPCFLIPLTQLPPQPCPPDAAGVPREAHSAFSFTSAPGTASSINFVAGGHEGEFSRTPALVSTLTGLAGWHAAPGRVVHKARAQIDHQVLA